MTLRDAITGVILVGGKSRRMGRDKAFLEVDGDLFFERVLQAMADNFSSVMLVGDRPERFARYGIPVHPDIYPGSALGGLYTGLSLAKTDGVFVAPCDMPSPSPSIIRHLCSFAAGFDAVVPLTGQGFEPLFALYRKTCLEPMKRHLDEGNLRVYDIYPEICARYVTEAELDLVQGGARSLININTPEELARFKENR